MRSYWIRLGPKASDGGLTRRRGVKRARKAKSESRELSDASTSPGGPGWPAATRIEKRVMKLIFPWSFQKEPTLLTP